jgi:hypothetical protein
MFRALTCTSSGGKIVFNTASGIFAFYKRLHSTQVERGPLSTCVLCRRLQRAKIPDAVLNTIFPPEHMHVNHLAPNGHFSGRTAPLTYKCCIFLFIQQIYVLNILNMLHTLRFFLFKMPFISYLFWFLYYSQFIYSVC